MSREIGNLIGNRVLFRTHFPISLIGSELLSNDPGNHQESRDQCNSKDEVRIPLDVARRSETISPRIPI